jgi:hypothetical protein
MSNRNARLFNLLLRKTSCDADFERGLEFPGFVFAIGAVGYGHAFETRDEDAVDEGLVLH